MILNDPRNEGELLTYLAANPSILEKAIGAKIIRINKYSGDFPDFELKVEREGKVRLERYELEWRTIDFQKHKHPEKGIRGILSVDGEPHPRLTVFKVDVPFQPTPSGDKHISSLEPFLSASKIPEIQKQIHDTLSRRTSIEWSVCAPNHEGYMVHLRLGSGILALNLYSSYGKLNDIIIIDIQKVRAADRTNLMKDLTTCLKDFGSVSTLQKLYKSGRWKHFSLEDFDPHLFVDFLERL
ncbi:MAG: hypothetical protein ACFFCW_28140 [Candidatus Hodarchaeota archaeon]